MNTGPVGAGREAETTDQKVGGNPETQMWKPTPETQKKCVTLEA